MQAFMCFKCGGTGQITPSKIDGGPACTKCGGAGYLTRELLKHSIASILDYPSVYMGGASQGSLKRAGRILEFMKDEWGIEFPEKSKS